MPKYKDEDGNEIEGQVLTEEEINRRIEEGKQSAIQEAEQAKKELEEVSKSLTDLEAERARLAAQIEGAGGDSANFKVLKDALDKKDKDITALRTEVDTIRKTRESDLVTKTINQLAKNDVELAKKIKFNFDTTLASVKASTEAEISNKINNAYRLSTDAPAPNPLDVALGGAGGRGADGASHGTGAQAPFTDREIALGAKLGITDEDRKRYAPRLTNNPK